MNDEIDIEVEADPTSCGAKNMQGDPCRAPATESGFCYVHSKPGRAAEIGREGGRRNRHFVDPTQPPLPDLSTTAGLCDAMALIIKRAYDGELSARRMAPLVPLFGMLERLQPAIRVEERLKDLENRLAAQSSVQTASSEGEA